MYFRVQGLKAATTPKQPQAKTEAYQACRAEKQRADNELIRSRQDNAELKITQIRA